MKNKIELKKSIIITIVTIIIFTVIFIVMYHIEYQTYTKQFNQKIDSIIVLLLQKYPKLEKNDIINILNSSNNQKSEMLREYGIDTTIDSVILKNDDYFNSFLIINICTLLLFSVLLFIIFWVYNKKKNKKLEEITQYIQQINKMNYSLDIDDNTEDELSILKNEIYKTTIMLKEAAENAIKQKVNLKNSLEDISHQLKTPLTSIMIMLDNLIDNQNMDSVTRNTFIKDCKREISNINFLVQALLKLSKFDANTILFHNQEILLKELIYEAVKKVSVLCDLKDINVIVHGNETDTIFGDFNWQLEAITNLIKNATEYSENSSSIEVTYSKNKLYTHIEIKDHGKGIDNTELPHIFERFYKGKNSQKDSVGIGLALAKTIIEKNGGNIYVESKENQGTKFILKYFNN